MSVSARRARRPNNSSKPTPLRGVVVTSSHPSVPASATLPQRRGLIQALGGGQAISVTSGKEIAQLLLTAALLRGICVLTQ